MEYEQMRLAEYEPQRFDMTSPSLFWSRPSDEQLVESLDKVGQIVPVLATVVRDAPRLLAGQRRVMALDRLGRSVTTLCLPDTGPWHKGLVFLESNAGQTLDDGLRISALRYFSSCRGEVDGIAPYLGVAARSRAWKLLMTWLELPPVWDELLEGGHLPTALAPLLTRFGPDDLGALYPYFKELSWSKNNAVHFVTWIWETSRARGCGPSELLDVLGLPEIFSRDLSPKDTMAGLLGVLWEARYPRLSGLQNRFKKTSRGVVAGSKWRLVQPDQFETGAVEFSVRVGSGAGLRRRVEELGKIAEHGIWDTLGDPGREL
ncbi:hypothetical protein [Desulfoplanes sp.]